MKFIAYISCVAVLLSMSGICMAAGVATVHGVAYEWSTFEPLDNAIIEVNSTPVQSIVAKSGVYSFDLPNGTYLIKATYYQNESLTHYGEEAIKVSDEGSYVVDLLLLPSFTNSGPDPATVGQETTGLDTSGSSSGDSSGILIGSSLTFILLMLILFYRVRYRKERPTAVSNSGGIESLNADPVVVVPASFEPARHESDMAALPSVHPDTQLQFVFPQEEGEVCDISPEHAPVGETKDPERPSQLIPADLEEILDILRSQGGRITQKDLRKRLRYSEGKVSLMLLDLEKRGMIQKFKKGRGNILFLVEDGN